LWKDLTVRAEELPCFSAPGARPQNLARSLGWLIAAALAVAAAAAVIWWRATARRHTIGPVGEEESDDGAR
jgi:hypothetical protein